MASVIGVALMPRAAAAAGLNYLSTINIIVGIPILSNDLSMRFIRCDRLCASVNNGLLSPLLFESKAANTVVRRLDLHLRKRRSQSRAQCFATSSKWLPATQANPSTDGGSTFLYDPPISRAQATSLSTAPALEPQLPQTCPGCGALTQESEADAAGFFSRNRRVVRIYLQKQKSRELTNQKTTPTKADTLLVHNDIEEAAEPLQRLADLPESSDVPLCDRCHGLVHDSKGQSIAHPTLEALADSIAESPFTRNHIYHVLDAADFPMSLIPNLHSKLSLAKPRSQNRRSQHDFSSRPTVSFIVTRSDLLGSTKEMVDSMLPYFQTLLRQAMAGAAKDLRLGNVHLVSAKRGWWTKDIKDKIWERGGGNWMLGKVNVGKSNLFEVLFPKGSKDRAPVHAELRKKQSQQSQLQLPDNSRLDHAVLAEDSLLPPAQPEVPFPTLPIVSSLPGTTASPIRLPFGRGKGELIDLPGLHRGELEQYVAPEHRLDLVMTHRENVEQLIVKAGQSLILGGGLIRITPQLDPQDRSTTVLAYPFVPLKSHVTSTEKATAQQIQQRESGIDSVLAEGAGQHVASAGMLELTTDVTKSRSGPLIRSGVPISRLPFRVYATDILVEGLGWVELVCQVRRQAPAQPASTIVTHEATRPPDDNEFDPDFAPFATQSTFGRAEGTFHFPQVEVFSPKGKHVSQRPCLGAWIRWTEGRKQKDSKKLGRPRRAMKGR